MAAETVELHKLKLVELKQECLARGLEAKGNKQDLINRLQTYLEQHAEEEANEEDVLGEETEEEEQKPLDNPIKEEIITETSPEISAEKKVVKITSEIPQMEKLKAGSIAVREETVVNASLCKEEMLQSLKKRMQKRAERFNVPVSLESKKAARAARFGMPTVSTKGLNTESKTPINMDKLKERAQRFGLNVSTISRKDLHEAMIKVLEQTFIKLKKSETEDDEKLKKRKERFGIVTSSAGAGTTEDTEAKKRKRAERFGLV